MRENAVRAVRELQAVSSIPLLDRLCETTSIITHSMHFASLL